MHTLTDGKFTYVTFRTVDGTPQRVEVSLDLNHLEVGYMLDRAGHNKSHRSVEAGGALVVKVSPL